MEEKGLDFFDYLDGSLTCPISRAVLTNNKSELQKLLNKRKKSPQPLPADNRKWTAIHVAAASDKAHECLDLLLQCSGNLIIDLEAKTFEGETALFLACSNGCKNNAEILLKRGSSPHAMKPDKTTPMHVTAMKGYADIVELLLKYLSNVDLRDWEDYTPLHLAALYNHYEICKLLLENNANFKLVDTNKNLPLHLACQNGNFDIVQLILNYDKTLINRKNQDSVTPLMLIVKEANTTVDQVKFLLKNGAKVDYCEKNDQLIPLSYSVFGGNTNIINLIYESTNKSFLLETCLHRFNYILKKDGVFHSLTSCALNSGSPKTLSALLRSKIPKDLLEAPYLENYGYVLNVLSPLSFLFCNFDIMNDGDFDSNLKLLLEHDIIYMNEFCKSVDFYLSPSCTRFTNPFSTLLKLPWNDPRKAMYLEWLLKYCITPDYCLFVYHDNSMKFCDFTVQIGYFTYYQSVLEAVCKGDIRTVEFCLANSSILEPDLLLEHFIIAYSCMSTNELNTHFYEHASSLCAMFNYLVKLKPSNFNYKRFHSAPRFIDFVSEDGFCRPNLQALCRNVIRTKLRGVTLNDNLTNFTERIKLLALPVKLKDYLLYRN